MDATEECPGLCVVALGDYCVQLISKKYLHLEHITGLSYRTIPTQYTLDTTPKYMTYFVIVDLDNYLVLTEERTID